MQVRNLNEFVTFRIGHTEDTERQKKWQEKIFGESYNIKQHISHLTKFATETGTQIFYEFLQNANDAKAESVSFFIDEGNLLVVNTGLPFYSDKHATNKPTDKKGQLYALLTKGDKFEDSESDGKYGQGAKLLYNLLLDTDQRAEEALYDTIATQLKGPILFSWSNPDSFEHFRYSTLNDLYFTGDCDNEKIPLLCKIINTSYPAFLGETSNGKVLFSKGELKKCLDFLEKCKLPPFARSGALLYIPLGKNQHRELLGLLQGDLKTGMSGALCHLKHLKTIEINDEHLKKANFEIIDFDFFTLGLPEQQTSTDFYNFYARYPITATKYGLNLIIDSQKYGITSARQHIETDEDSKKSLAQISEAIVKHINKIGQGKDKNIAQLITLIRCVLSSKPRGIDSLNIKKLFHDDLLEAIKRNLPTTENTIGNTDNAFVKKTKMPINLKELGINWHFLHEKLADCEIGKLGIKEANIIKILREANQSALTQWIRGLNNAQYDSLLSEIESQATPQDITDLRFVRANDHSVYSPKELGSAPDKILLYPEIKELYETLGRFKIVCSDKMVAEHQLLAGKPNYETLISLVNEKGNRGQTSDKWNIVKCLKKNGVDKKQIRDINIFYNINNETHCLSQLCAGEIRLASGIIDQFKLRADQYSDDLKDYLMQPNEMWAYLTKDKPSWDKYIKPYFHKIKYDALMSDIQTLYARAGNTGQIPSDCAWIKTQSGNYCTPNEVYFNSNISKNLNEREYEILCDFVQSNTKLETTPFDNIDIVKNIFFTILPHISNEALAKHWVRNETSITEAQLNILLKIQGSRSSFLETYIIKQNILSYSIRRKETNEKQYTCQHEDINAFLARTKSQRYFLLPPKLLPHFETDSSLQQANDDFTLNLIATYGSEHCFIRLVEVANDNIKQYFLNEMPSFELSKQIVTANLRKIFELYTQKNWVEIFREKILLNDNPISRYDYNHQVTVSYGDKKATFNLADLMPKHGKDAEAIEQAKSFLGSNRITYTNLFDTKPFPKDKIMEALSSRGIKNTEQLCFLWAYKKSSDGANTNLNNFSLQYLANAEKALLDSLCQHKLTFFAEFTLPQNCFNPTKHIADTPDALTLESERLPPFVTDWIANKKAHKDFLIQAGLSNANSPIIKIRRALLDEEELSIPPGLLYLYLHNTLIWANRQGFNAIERGSYRYTSLQKIILILAKHSKQKTSHCLYLNEDLTLRLAACTEPMYHTTASISEEESHIWKDAILYLKPKVAIIDAPHDPEIGKYFGTLVELKSEFDETEAQKAQEWDNEHYKAWKSNEAKGYQIYATKTEVPFKFQLTNTSFAKTYNTGTANRLGKKIYAFFDQNNPFKFLMDNQDPLFPHDKEMLIALVNRTFPNSNGSSQGENEGGSGNVSISEDKKDVIEKIASSLDVKTLEDILSGKLKPSKDEDEESSASELIGRIGEELAMKWLESRGLKPEHVAVTKGQKEYDILVRDDKTGQKRYIDAKTSTKSVVSNDRSVPLHIHSAAMRLLEAEPNCNYYIIRISLKDIGIDHWNEELKTQFKYSGPERKLSAGLIQEIKKKVDAFWQKKENQGLFGRTTKEFRLNMPKVS